MLLGGDASAPVHEYGVRVEGAYINGMLNLENCEISFSMSLKKCRFNMQLIMQDAIVKGVVELSGSHLEKLLTAERMKCKGSLCLNNNFIANEEIKLTGAEIEQSVYCDGGKFLSQSGMSLVVDNAKIKGQVALGNGFKAIGQVRFVGSQLSSLNCGGGIFKTNNGNSIVLDRSVINGNVNFTKGFMSIGKVKLIGAEINGDLNCSDGIFQSVVSEDTALVADRALINGSIIFSGDFKFSGQVSLMGAHIKKYLVCTNGEFEPRRGFGLILQSSIVRGPWQIHGLKKPVHIDAMFMEAHILEDEIECWAKNSVFNGFTYTAFGGVALTNAINRIKWINKQTPEHLGLGEIPGFKPQPWRQLQKVLREMGHKEDARQVGMAYEQQLFKADLIGPSKADAVCCSQKINRWAMRFMHGTFGLLAGHGYRPMRILWSMLSVWLVCGLFYACLARPPLNAVGPTVPAVFQHTRYGQCTKEFEGNWLLCNDLPAEYTTFSPWAYSLDILLPIVDLGQEKDWGPVITTPSPGVWTDLLFNWSPGHWVRLLNWFEILYGWLATSLLVAIVSGLSRRSDSESQ